MNKRIAFSALVAAVGVVILLPIIQRINASARYAAAAIQSIAQGTASIGGHLDSQEKIVRNIRGELSSLQQQQYRQRAPDLQGISIDVSISRNDDGPMTPVSMARIGEHEFLIANYQNIYLFDQDRRTAIPLEIDAELPLWDPTAVFYSTFYDWVFIANYEGRDIIVAQVVRTQSGVKLHLVERITNDFAIKGAEGVSVSPGGRFMGIADYDGNAISMFERVDDRWVFRWKNALPGSHGITIIGDEVYASGEGIIAKYSLETGYELGKVTKIGSEPILFATCINEDEKTGGLVGSDAMSGIVFTMTKNLELTHRFGANGPTFANFSEPFCAYRDRDAMYVLSTYQDRLVAIGDETTTSFEFGIPRWRYIKNHSTFRNHANMLQGLVQFDAPSYQMFDKTVRAGYGALDTVDGKKLLMPNRGDLFGGQWPFYVTSIASDAEWLLIVANSSPMAILYNRKTGELGATTLGEWDCWAHASEILCPSRRYEIEEVASAVNILDSAEEAAVPGDWVGNAIPLEKYWSEWITRVNERAASAGSSDLSGSH